MGEDLAKLQDGVEELEAQIQRLREDHEDGSMEARIESLYEFTEEYLGHSRFSARAPEGVLFEAYLEQQELVESLVAKLDEAEGALIEDIANPSEVQGQGALATIQQALNQVQEANIELNPNDTEN
jgi:hypothetical protein